MSDIYFEAKELVVGYNGRPILGNVSFKINRGEIVTLIGPNGAGKSTILKSISRQLKLLGGSVFVEDMDLWRMPAAELAKKMAVMLTDRMNPEQMTCRDVVMMGRYPYTGLLGLPGDGDEEAVDRALAAVDAEELSGCGFTAVSDGQRQRILLARAIAQEPEIIILDEPTSFLDIRCKIELAGILRKMADAGITVVLSLHEVDLAQKLSDRLICVGSDGRITQGTPEELYIKNQLSELYGLGQRSFDPVFGSFELRSPKGEPQVLVISSSGSGISVYRRLQRRGIPFAAAILYENDIDYRVASMLSSEVVSERSFRRITDEALTRARELVDSCREVVLCSVEIGDCNSRIEELIQYARESGKLVLSETAGIFSHTAASSAAKSAESRAENSAADPAVNSVENPAVSSGANSAESNAAKSASDPAVNSVDFSAANPAINTVADYAADSSADSAANVDRVGSKLRRGYTTGSCAAASAAAAARLLLTGEEADFIRLTLPRGENIVLQTEDIHREGEAAVCAVRKYAGDDPDITDGMLVESRVEVIPQELEQRIVICGGEGVGRVTRAGLDQPPGAAALNTVPRAMIRDAVFKEMTRAGFSGSIRVTVSIPGGEEAAERTFNPRLGIVGGLSILGTTGIVEPMSDSAVIETVRIMIRQRIAEGDRFILAVPGNYGRDFARDELGLDPEAAVICSNFIGDTIDFAGSLGADGLLLAGHIGKLCKIAAGIMNTHSKVADGRMEVLGACAVKAGADAGTARRILGCVTTDDALEMIRGAGLFDETIKILLEEIENRLTLRAGSRLTVGAVIFSNSRKILGMTSKASGLLEAIKRQQEKKREDI